VREETRIELCSPPYHPGLAIPEAHKGETMRIRLVSLMAVLGFALCGAGTVYAQIVGQIETKIPFPFYVGDAKLPAGDYVIRPLSDTDGTVMEISTPDGRNSALFEVRQSRDNTPPQRTELIFDKYGDHYVLAKLYDQGSAAGDAVLESRYQKRFESASPNHEERHVPAHHEGH
jgi:hypothetical protein